MTKSFLTFFCAAAATLTSANAALTSVAPFSGTYSESFESFANYNVTGALPQPFSIMGGFADVSNGSLIGVYEVGVADFFLPTAAPAHDGTKGLGVYPGSITISFDSPVSDFGGYFGAAYGTGGDGKVSFTFSDGSTEDFTFTGGALVWQGWSSDVPITSVTIGDNYMVMDSLQANAAPTSVPDGGATLVLFGLGLGSLQILRRKLR